MSARYVKFRSMTTLETKAPSTNWRRDLIVDGRRLALLDTGEHDRTCVLVHGLAASWDYWRLTIPALTASHRVVAVDLPGFGYSEDRGRYGPDELVKVLIELVNQERIDTVDLIGHSMGTVVVSEFAARYPDRVDRLVLTGGPIISVLDLPNHPYQTLRRQPQVATFIVEALTAGIKLPPQLQNLIVRRGWARWAAFRAYMPHPERIDDDVFAGVLRGVGARAVLPTLYGGWWWRYDLRNALVNVTCPTLVIAGERDTISPVGDVEEFARIARTNVTVEHLLGHRRTNGGHRQAVPRRVVRWC